MTLLGACCRILAATLLCGMARASAVITDLRLVNGTKRCEGRVEVSYSNDTGELCAQGWNLQTAGVVCNQLGCGPVKEATTRLVFGPSSGSHCLSNLICYGTEKDIALCGSRDSGLEWANADKGWAASVICSNTVLTDIRLEGGSHNCEGRVEVKIGDTWGTVCDNDWDVEDAAVICKQSKCGAAQAAPQGGRFGQGAPALLDNFHCSGSETSLAHCASVQSNTCEPQHTAGVICNHKIEIGHVELHGGTNKCNGRVELKYDNVMVTISHYNWDNENTEVVCREVRCGPPVSVEKHAYFGAGSGPILLKALYCNGSESSIASCSAVISDDIQATHAEDLDFKSRRQTYQKPKKHKYRRGHSSMKRPPRHGGCQRLRRGNAITCNEAVHCSMAPRCQYTDSPKAYRWPIHQWSF